jgi:hypothetical protein
VLLTGALAAGILPLLPRHWRLAGLLAAGLLPAAWGQIGASADPLAVEFSPYLLHLNPSGELPSMVQYFDTPVQRPYQMTTGQALEGGAFGAQAPKHPAGILKSYYTPLIQPGVTTYFLTDVHADHAPGQVAGHFALAQRQVLPAVADWGVFHTQPITDAGLRTKLSFFTAHTGLGYVYVEFAGAGALAFREITSRFVPVHLTSHLSELRRFEGKKTNKNHPSLGVYCENLERGYYLARYHLKGSALGAFFERNPVPVYMAVYAAQNSPAGGPSLEAQATRWLSEYFAFQDQTPRPNFIRPLVESIQAPWWTAVPLVGASAYELEFGLDQAQEVWLLFDYLGNAGLELAEIALYRVQLSSSVQGN